MIYVIFGPTACGKTQAAIELSKKFNAPIINADAFQVYKDMNIGTAKISKDDPNYHNHYLLDIISPNKSFNVKEYQHLFRKTINKFLNKGLDVIVVGGTGLYIKASFYDYDFQKEEEAENTDDLEEMSNESLYSLLSYLDPKSAESIHPNNRKRVIRAINIARNSLTKKSENIEKQKHVLLYPDVKFLFINPERESLYQNIEKRVDDMFDLGLIEEVKTLLQKYRISETARQGIGYKEVIDYLEGKYTLDECKNLIKQRTRNYAKRQITFFKNQFNSQLFTSKDALIEEISNDR